MTALVDLKVSDEFKKHGDFDLDLQDKIGLGTSGFLVLNFLTIYNFIDHLNILEYFENCLQGQIGFKLPKCLF